jgi:hypothetical protein
MVEVNTLKAQNLSLVKEASGLLSEKVLQRACCRLADFLTNEWTFQNSWHCHLWLQREK